MRLSKQFLLVCLSLSVMGPVFSQQNDIEIEPRPADPAPLSHKSLILDVVRAGERYIAVGERGHVVISRDGKEWEQARFVPVTATLTRVAFIGGRLWAVGHDTTIIHSRDLGETWSLQHFEPGREQPLLDVHFFNANEGIAVGAYGLFMRTANAGRDWDVLEIAELVTSEAIDWAEAAEVEEEFADELGATDDLWEEDFYDAEQDFDRGCYEFMECHLNAILDLNDGRVMIAAERGYGYRSVDRGETWESFRFPYPGSMFGLLQANEGILAFGLRGNVQYSNDFGDEWQVMDSGLESSLMGGAINPEGNPVMVGSGAAILTYDVQSGQFRLSEDRLGSDYAALLFAEDGHMILAGEDGLKHE